jgi:dynein heavy chain
VQSVVEKRNQENQEDPKTRRRRLYKIVSEEKPTFPVQIRNFHSIIMENKEIIKMFSILSTCTQNIRQVGISLYLINGI